MAIFKITSNAKALEEGDVLYINPDTVNINVNFNKGQNVHIQGSRLTENLVNNGSGTLERFIIYTQPIRATLVFCDTGEPISLLTKYPIDKINNICLKPYNDSESYTVQFTYSLIDNQDNVSNRVIVNIDADYEDRPPVSVDTTITLNNRVNGIITKEDLDYSDPDGDNVTKVKFEGDVSSLYTDSNYRNPYIAGTELPIDFTLYHKAKDTDQESSYTINYYVNSNGKWSN